VAVRLEDNGVGFDPTAVGATRGGGLGLAGMEERVKLIGGTYTLSGTIGQPVADLLTGGSYQLVGGFWPATLTVPVAGGPTLRLELGSTEVSISWSPATTGFLLQQTDALGSAWTLVNTALSSTRYAVASSADGIKQVAAADGGFIRVSTDHGRHWNYDSHDRKIRITPSAYSVVLMVSPTLIDEYVCSNARRGAARNNLDAKLHRCPALQRGRSNRNGRAVCPQVAASVFLHRTRSGSAQCPSFVSSRSSWQTRSSPTPWATLRGPLDRSTQPCPRWPVLNGSGEAAD
jgi:hypothetical protein